MGQSTWLARAACRGVPTSLFFAERGDVITAATARAFCSCCPVRVECLDDALDHEIGPRYGIVGGTSPGERQLLARGRRPTSAVAVATPKVASKVTPSRRRLPTQPPLYGWTPHEISAARAEV